MRYIQMFDGRRVKIDDADYALVSKYKWHDNRGRLRNPYACTSVFRKGKSPKKIFMHRLIMNPPQDKFIDHINGNTLDNRRCNLRICTRSQNGMNRNKMSHNKSGYKGVCFFRPRGTWLVQLIYNQKRVYQAYFKDKKVAAEAYNKKALEYFGEFASLNKI